MEGRDMNLCEARGQQARVFRAVTALRTSTVYYRSITCIMGFLIAMLAT